MNRAIEQLQTTLIAFAAGVSVAFLTPGHDEEARIYSRAGFTPVAEILHISRSPV